MTPPKPISRPRATIVIEDNDTIITFVGEIKDYGQSFDNGVRIEYGDGQFTGYVGKKSATLSFEFVPGPYMTTFRKESHDY